MRRGEPMNTITCIKCPLSCEIEVMKKDNQLTVKGHTCPQGEQYAIDEFTNPVRVLTTTVCVQDGVLPVVPVRSEAPIPKPRIKECVHALRTVTVKAPVTCGDIILKNILNTGVSIIASRDLPENP